MQLVWIPLLGKWVQMGLHNWLTMMVNQIIEKLSKESIDVTQWMNHAAIFASWFIFGNTTEDMANILHHNVKQGFPRHFHGKYMTLASCSSKVHQIQRICRSEIKELHPKWSQNMISSLMSATVFHSADNYLIDKYVSFSLKSRILKMDLQLCSLKTALLTV